jgi:hypothetical protein
MNTLRLRLMTTSACATLTALAFGLIAGCSDDTGLEKRYPVSGTVTYKDQPLQAGQIAFIPAAPNDTKLRPANGTIVDGRYTLTTAAAGDGAFPGKYKVSVSSLDIDTTQVLETVKKFGGGGRQGDIGKAAAKAKSLIPAKYLSSEQSGLEATVEPKSNQIDFKLTDSP